MAGGLEVRVTSSDIAKVAAKMRAEGRKDLAREMGAALDRVAKPVQGAIRRSAAETMPSGYRWAFTKSLAWRTSRRAGAQQAMLKLATYADGKDERRDILALEDGRLRHPLWGRRAQTWYVTSIRAGFHRRGTDGASDQMVAELDLVVREFTRKLIS